MNVYDYLDQPEYRADSVKERVVSRILKESNVYYEHHDDAKQEIYMTWLKNEVKLDFKEDLNIQSVVSFAFKIGQQACFGYKRNMTGALKIPRRVIKEHREQGVKLVTDMVDISIVKENEVTESIEPDDRRVFELPIQYSLYPLPKVDQNIEKDINEGESLANVLFSSGFEKRALQSKLVNLTKMDEEYASLLYAELVAETGFTDNQLTLY